MLDSDWWYRMPIHVVQLTKHLGTKFRIKSRLGKHGITLKVGRIITCQYSHSSRASSNLVSSNEARQHST